MVHRSSPRGETPAVPVVLCCALAEEADVQEVGRTFAERGHPVEVLPGVELEPRALAAAIDRLRGEGLYVLCRAGALDRARVDALREVLLARRVPFGRTLTVGTTRPSELQERVEQGLKKVLPTPKPPPGSANVGVATATNASGRPRRQTIPVIPASVTRTLQGGPRPMPPRAETRRSDPPRPAADARASQPPAATLDTNVDPVAGDDTGVLAPSEETHAGVRLADATNAARLAEPATLETNVQRTVSEDTQGQARVEATNADAQVLEPAVPRPPVAIPRPPMHAADHDGDEPSVVTAIFEDSHGRASGRFAREVEADSDLLDDAVTLQQPKEDDELPSIDLDRVLEGIGEGPDPTARGNTVIARAEPVQRGDTVVARGDTAIARGLTQRAPSLPFEGYPEEAELSLSDGEVIGDRTQVAPAPRPPPLPRTASPSTPEASATEPRSGSGKLLFAAIAGALALGILVAVMVSSRNDDASSEIAKRDTPAKSPDGEPAKPSDPKPSTAEGPAAEPEAKAELLAQADPPTTRDPQPGDPVGLAIPKPGGKLPATARNTTPPPPRTRVQLALRQRAVRALDVLLVARRPSKPLSWTEAAQHCSSLDVLGIQGWRLPDVGELASLGDAGMLGRGMYWSQTAGDTFGDTHMAWNGRSNHASTRDRGVALCVRGEHGATP